MTCSHPSLPTLADRQALGILPTRAFWARSHVQDVAAGLCSVLALSLLPAMMLAFLAGLALPAWAWFGVFLVLGTLAEGLFERYLRLRLRRRAQTVLGACPGENFQKTVVLDATSPRRGRPNR